MAVKYFIRYFDVIGIEHKLDIYDDSYNDQPIQVDGNITLTYSDTDNSLEAIRGKGLSVELEADANLTFNDLWSEEEKTFRTVYKRADVILFQGWLNPEGFFENWVDPNWKVTFDCVDGLGYLKDLSFVEETGLPITGRKTYLEILSLALRRTGLQLNINTAIDIRYTGLNSSLDVLDNVYANTERYVKDDGETIMSCDEVIRDILEPFGAVLTTLFGKWHIYKPNQLYHNNIVTFYQYDYKGVLFNNSTTVQNLGLTIGSEVNDFSPHHCSANQSIRNTSSVGAYRINYKYGLAQKLLDNINLFSSNGVTINDFTILSTQYTDPLTIGGSGVVFNPITNISELITPSVENIRTNKITINSDTRLNVSISTDGFTNLNNANFDILYQIIITDGDIDDVSSNKYYLNDDFSGWGNANIENTLKYTNLQYESLLIEVSTPEPPVVESLFFYVKILTPRKTFRQDAFISKINLNEVKITPSTQSSGVDGIIGEFHTLERTAKPSSKVNEVKDVATGDNTSDIYEGTIYKNDSLTPTETWNREGVVEEKPLLQIMGEETLRINQLPSRVFTGDLYGFFDYLSVVDIDGLDGVFMPIKYRYDTQNNIISCDFKQIYGDELIDIDYKKTFDYGNTVKPTIKG